MKFELFVFSYNTQASLAVRTLNELITKISNEYGINFICSIQEGEIFYPQYNQLIQEFLDIAKTKYGYLDINWLYALNWYLRMPEADIIEYYSDPVLNVNIEILQPFFERINENRKSYTPIETSCFYTVSGINLINNQGPWGTNCCQYPKGVSIDTKGYKEVIIHEFLHLFDVGEGYDDNFDTICDPECWMQYDATKGSLLCQMHQDELRIFIKSYNEKFTGRAR